MIDVGKADEQEEIARHEELWTLQGRIVRGLNKRMMVTEQPKKIPKAKTRESYAEETLGLSKSEKL
eukprot:5435068-Pyramimonas_sp.AAC.1